MKVWGGEDREGAGEGDREGEWDKKEKGRYKDRVRKIGGERDKDNAWGRGGRKTEEEEDNEGERGKRGRRGRKTGQRGRGTLRESEGRGR